MSTSTISDATMFKYISPSRVVKRHTIIRTCDFNNCVDGIQVLHPLKTHIAHDVQLNTSLTMGA